MSSPSVGRIKPVHGIFPLEVGWGIRGFHPAPNGHLSRVVGVPRSGSGKLVFEYPTSAAA